MEHFHRKAFIGTILLCGLLFLSLSVLAGCHHELPLTESDSAPNLQEGAPSAEAATTLPSTASEPPSSTTATTEVPPSESEPITEEEPRQFLIVIDPGHQLYGDYSEEPLGPGSDQLKARVSSGTEGTVTKLPEHELNLTVSLLLQQELLARGYRVVLTRETADVSISNGERALIANDLHADAFLRIHANSDSDSSVHGALTICMTPNNTYNSDIYEESRLLSDHILTELCLLTGAKNRSVWETDSMTGINWSQVPVTIVEMGFLSNEAEDRLLSDPNYQEKIVEGIENGLDRYFTALTQ